VVAVLALWQSGVDLGQSQPLPLLVGNLLWNLNAIVFATVSALIIARQPRNTIGWVLMVFPLLLAASAPVDNYYAERLRTATELTGGLWFYAWFNTWSWWLLIGPVFLISQLFPTGRPLTPRWRWGLVAVAGWFVLFLVIATFSPTFEFDDRPSLPNPLSLSAFEPLLVIGSVFVLGVIALALLSVVAIFVRYWRASTVERQQIKWLAYALAVFAVIYTIGGLTASDVLTGTWFDVLLPLTIMLLPLTIAIAILRYRLWDLDILIRRTLSYSLLTAALALAYFGSVVVLQTVAQALTGESSNALVTVISTLLIAALFVPLRGRIQRLIDQRFSRRKYDAARTLAAFGATARDVVELEQLSGQLAQAVDETMQPAHVSLWVRPGDKARAGELGQ
jgi:hypothetical protein